MTDQYLKIQSVQGGPFSSSQNLVDFRIPAGEVYDLSDSYVNFNMALDVANDAGGVYNYNLEWTTTGNDLHFDNVAVVKNANMKASSTGTIENIRRVDILRQNLGVYNRSLLETTDESYLAGSQYANPVGNGQQVGIFTQINKTGIDKSRYNSETPLSVRLQDVFEFARVPEYDTSKAGETHVHFELNLDKLSVRQLSDEFGPGVVGEGAKQVATDTATGNNITIGDNTNDVALKFTDLNQSPYWVGQALKVSATCSQNAAKSVTDAEVVVSEIVWDRDTGAITLKFESDWSQTLTGAEEYTDITLGPRTAAATLSFPSAEIILRRVANPDPNPAPISYHTYSTEETQGNGATAFQQLYTVESEASNVMIMFPSESNGLLSSNGDIASWRLRLDQEDLTDRPVNRKSPLAYDRLSTTLHGMGQSLRNLTQNLGCVNPRIGGDWPAVFKEADLNTILIGNPLFQTGQTKLLQVNIESGGNGIKKLVLFKQLPRVFTY